MGREIKRVPLDFDFPIGESYHDHAWALHRESCNASDDHDECEDIHTSPPKGDGWQLWQTVSDGPTSPVFATPEALIDWMSQPVPLADQPHWNRTPWPERPWGQGWRRDVAERFVRGTGWMPSLIVQGGRILPFGEEPK